MRLVSLLNQGSQPTYTAHQPVLAASLRRLSNDKFLIIHSVAGVVLSSKVLITTRVVGYSPRTPIIRNLKKSATQESGRHVMLGRVGKRGNTE